MTYKKVLIWSAGIGRNGYAGPPPTEAWTAMRDRLGIMELYRFDPEPEFDWESLNDAWG